MVLTVWKEWVKKSEVGVRMLAEEIVATIGDEHFWEEVNNILAITKPIYLMVKFSRW